MSGFSPFTALFATVGAFAGITGGALFFPPPPFMAVTEVTVTGEDVTAEREIFRYVVADWRVTVVSKNADKGAPSCQTIPGYKLHEGWSDYRTSDKATRTMSLDVWVGDTGCAERLTPGDYLMFVTWTPRDGSPPIVNKTEFTWTK